MDQPLTGINVVELAGGIAGPFAGKLLADFGAEVIKVEPPDGDRARRLGPVIPGPGGEAERSALFLHLGTNKRSVVADIHSEDGADLVRRLVAGADIVIESLDTADLVSLGLVPGQLRPGLAVVSVTSFGRTGPYAGYKGEEIVHYAVGGPMSCSGLAEREPVKMGADLGQYQCGNVAALAALAAHHSAVAAGRGVHVDLANVETQVASIDRRMSFLLYGAYTHRDAPRSAGRSVGPFPAGVMPTEDGYVNLATMPLWLPRMLTTLGDPDLAGRYADPGFLVDPELPEMADTAILTWTITRTRQAAMEEAQANGWPVLAVNLPVDVLADPHFAERGFWVDVEHPTLGRVRQPGAPIRFHAGGWQLRRPAPTLGQHTDEVRAQLDAATVAPTPAPASGPAAASIPGGVAEAADGHPAEQLPLAGLRVLDLTVVWAGPYATMFLADLGAEVIRVDNPWIFPTSTRGLFARPRPEMVEELGPIFGGYPDMDAGERPWNRVALFTSHARNKRSITLDLRKPSGRETLLRLAEHCDVVVENNAVDLLDKLGVGWDALHARNPKLIMVRLPAVGLDGPYRSYLGFGVNFEALCGLGALRGYPDIDLSENEAVFHMDAASGAAGAFATMAALRRVDRTGEGELVELPQTENMMNHIGELFVEAAATGVRHERRGNRHCTRAPQGVYRSVDVPEGQGGAGAVGAGGTDRWVAISVGDDDEWAGLVRAMGQPDWAADERFARADGRMAHHDEIDRGITTWTQGLTHIDAFHRCQAEGVPAGPVLTESECYADPHLADRGAFRENGSAELGRHQYASHAWRWDGPELAWGDIPLLGQDNEAVYRDLLGLDDEGYAALEADGHLSRDYLGPDGTPL